MAAPLSAHSSQDADVLGGTCVLGDACVLGDDACVLGVVFEQDLEIEAPFVLKAKRNDYCHALVIWFDVGFTQVSHPCNTFLLSLPILLSRALVFSRAHSVHGVDVSVERRECVRRGAAARLANCMPSIDTALMSKYGVCMCRGLVDCADACLVSVHRVNVVCVCACVRLCMCTRESV